MMKKTFLVTIMLLVAMLTFAGCGEETDKDGRLIGNDPDTSITQDLEDGANDVIDDTERVGDDLVDDMEDVLDGDDTESKREFENNNEKRTEDKTTSSGIIQ